MTQTQLNRAVARVTGDDLAVVAAHGFNLVEEDDPGCDDDRQLLMMMEQDDFTPSRSEPLQSAQQSAAPR